MSLLRDRNFLLLFVGQGVSRFGDGLYAAATAWLAWSLAKDPTAVAVVSVSAFTPAFVSASYADRYDRRKLMIATGLASALTDIPLIALVAAIPSHDLAQALGLWKAGVAGALAVSPFVASTTIALTGVKDAFLLSGAALVDIFVTHDLAVARLVASEVAVMYAGGIVERGGIHDIYRRPAHPLYPPAAHRTRPTSSRAAPATRGARSPQTGAPPRKPDLRALTADRLSRCHHAEEVLDAAH
jgi:hypothetical protein